MDIYQKVLKSLSWKRSNQESASRLGISLEEYMEIKHEIKNADKEEIPVGSSYSEDLEKGTAEYKIETSFQPRTAEEIKKLINLDETKFKLSRYSVWNCGKEDCWLTSIRVQSVESKDTFSTDFIDFIKNYTSPHKVINTITNTHSKNAILILPNQDCHHNKYDINGNNDIQLRFDIIQEAEESILKQASSVYNLEKIVYIIGSDSLNSEAGLFSATTKGTAQQNILTYNIAFQEICYHEVECINKMLKYGHNIDVIFICGNHDQFSGWHIISWLQAYYKDQKNIKFDISTDFTKYMRYSNTALCFNHFDVMKPEKLAEIFPINFKQEWSKCDHYVIIGGDKHTELTRSIGAIKFFRVQALSSAKSMWDSQNGYTSTPAEMNAFLIRENKGVTNIYKEVL